MCCLRVCEVHPTAIPQPLHCMGLSTDPTSPFQTSTEDIGHQRIYLKMNS